MSVFGTLEDGCVGGLALYFLAVFLLIIHILYCTFFSFTRVPVNFVEIKPSCLLEFLGVFALHGNRSS